MSREHMETRWQEMSRFGLRGRGWNGFAKSLVWAQGLGCPVVSASGLRSCVCFWGGAGLVDGTAIMRCSENLIQNPPLFRVVLNYAMLARPGLKGGGPGSQKLKTVVNKKLRNFLVSSLI